MSVDDWIGSSSPVDDWIGSSPPANEACDLRSDWLALLLDLESCLSVFDLLPYEVEALGRLVAGEMSLWLRAEKACLVLELSYPLTGTLCTWELNMLNVALVLRRSVTSGVIV